jgi:hypothetical protein
MTFEPSGKSREETPMEGPRDGASAELETQQSLSSNTSCRMPFVAYFVRLAQFSRTHGVVCDSELNGWYGHFDRVVELKVVE